MIRAWLSADHGSETIEFDAQPFFEHLGETELRQWLDEKPRSAQTGDEIVWHCQSQPVVQRFLEQLAAARSGFEIEYDHTDLERYLRERERSHSQYTF